MSYLMAGGVFGEMQNARFRENADYADFFKTQASLAQANRAAAMAAQQEALRQAQLAEAYDFQDLQNQQIQKQRALENAMSADRNAQHKYEFGERLKSEAANLKAAQEMEKLRIGEQKAREAERQDELDRRTFIDMLKISRDPGASFAEMEALYKPSMAGENWQQLAQNMRETQERSQMDAGRLTRAAERLNAEAERRLRGSVDAPATFAAYVQEISKGNRDFDKQFDVDYAGMQIRPIMPYFRTDAIPSASDTMAAREYFLQGKPYRGRYFETAPGGSPRLGVPAPRPEAAPQVPQSAPRAAAPSVAPRISAAPRTPATPTRPPESAYSFASESEPDVGFSEREAGFPGMINLVNPGSRYNVINRIYGDRPTSITYPEGPGLYFGDADPNRISRQQENQTREEDANLGWFRRKQRQDGLKRATDALSSGAPATRLTDAAAGAALAPSMGGGTERNAELGVKQARWLADRAKDFVMQKAREVAAGRIALPPDSAMAAPIFVAAKLIQDGMWGAAEKISEQAAEEQFWQHRLDAGGRTVSGDEMLQLTQQAAAEGRL